MQIKNMKAVDILLENTILKLRKAFTKNKFIRRVLWIIKK